MPGFWGHTTANAVVLVGTTMVMRWQGWSWQDVMAVDAGIAVATFVLSPDMDLFRSESIKGWGVLRYLWLPYAKLAKHRDRLHLPVAGTLVRWLYVMAILALFVILFRFWFRRIGLQVSFDFAGDADDIIYNALYIVDVFIGAVIADTTHYLLDVASTRLKRLIPRRYRERYERYAQRHRERDRGPLRGSEWNLQGEER